MDDAADLSSSVAAARAELERAIVLAGLERDPLGHAYRAQSNVIGLFPKLVAGIEAARRPLANEDLNRLSSAAARGAQTQAMRLARSANRLTIAVGLLGGLALLIAAYAIGSWSGWRSGFNEGNRLGLAANAALSVLPSEDAAVWARLIRDNPTVAEAMQSCMKNVATQNGRAMCSLPVWIEPLPPPGRAGHR